MTLYDEGLKVRKEVLGAETVERRLERLTPFTEPFETLLIEYCWGAVWTRPGLERKFRSLLNVAMLTALNRQDELEVHLKSALTNGASEEEIRETLLQATIYCGVPAGRNAFGIAERVLEAAKAGGD
jgi:4-carboxymuconolactone decarboxylase